MNRTGGLITDSPYGDNASTWTRGHTVFEVFPYLIRSGRIIICSIILPRPLFLRTVDILQLGGTRSGLGALVLTGLSATHQEHGCDD